MFERIRSALASEFIYSDDIARAVALAVESGKNLLLWGPAGHGKSEMITRALSVVAAESEIFVQSFGEGMDEATLWGGLDFAALERDKEMKFFPANSFLAKKFAILEELFDAPASVLLALKDTLTARILRKGNQRYAMTTRSVIALTNKDPSEVSELGPAAHALIERFPLQLRVSWPSYEAADYAELFRKVSPRLPGADLNGHSAILAEMLAKVGEQGEAVSPRSAVHALGVVKTAAALRGSAVVEQVDLLDLRFVDGFEALASDLKTELDKAAERAAAENMVKLAEDALAHNLRELEESKGANSPIRLLQAARRLQAFGDEVSNLKVTDGLTERRKQLRETAAAKALEAQKCALESTRV